MKIQLFLQQKIRLKICKIIKTIKIVKIFYPLDP